MRERCNDYTHRPVFPFTSKIPLCFTDSFADYTQPMLAPVIVIALLTALVATEPDSSGRGDA